MKKGILLVAIFLLLFSACGKQGGQKREGSKDVKVGPVADKIYVNVRMKEEIALKDVAEGLSDVFFFGVEGPVIMGLDQATRDKLDIYSVPSGWWSLLFNPIPNEAPYIVKADKKEYFNPFAIREVRFAMNFLINRKYIVDEILAGAGGPMFTMATPNQPGTYRYTLVASRMGLTAEGDEERAIKDIATALESAAALPALKGRLKKDAEWWTFDGNPVTIKFLIRVDDPQGRLKEGEYVALQIEKAGIKVDRLLWDRSRCSKAVYGGNPANYEWNIYTEGWGSGATRRFWEHIVAQMYAPWYGYMPGGQDPNNWNYKHEEIDDLTEKAYSGNFLTEEEYWDLALKGLELGTQEAVRLPVAYQNNYFAANKERFNRRMAYGMGDGLNKWSLITADTKDGVLKITGFSAKGALFMNAWDPIGTDGFADIYSMMCAEPACDVDMFESPATAVHIPLRAVPKEVETKVKRDENGEVVGEIPVAEDAIAYDSKKDEWVKMGPGKTAMTKATYTLRLGNYHHGQPMRVADMLYREALREEWANKDGEDDRYHDAAFESSIKPIQKTRKGYVFNDDGTVTTYFDYNFPPSEERVANWGAPDITIFGNREINVSWDILEACALLVAEGSASGTAYSFTYGEATEIDLLRPSCVEDLKAKLTEMKEKKHLPKSVKDFMTVEDAVASYEAAIKWIDEHGHAYIGNGPFFIDKYDPSANYMELTAFRDPSYPFKSDYWPEYFETTLVQIDNIEVPAMVSREATEKGLAVKVYVSEVLYPEGSSELAEKGTVSIMLVTPTEELSFPAKKVKSGIFEATIPAKTIQSLEPGPYTILANAEREGAVPAATSGSITIY